MSSKDVDRWIIMSRRVKWKWEGIEQARKALKYTITSAVSPSDMDQLITRDYAMISEAICMWFSVSKWTIEA